MNSLEGLGIEPPICERVLVVDDEPENLIVLEALLEDHFEVFTATSGAAALQLLQEQVECDEPIDLVITDQRMPGMTGVQLLITASQKYPDTVRMILTGYSDVDPIVDAVNGGSVYRFLLKPWDGEELLAAVTEGLALKNRQAALRTAVDELMDRRSRGQKVLADLKRTQDQFVAAERLSTLGRLTAGITHDIRNQLSALLFMVDLVQSESDDPAVHISAQNAYDTLQSLKILIGDVNAFAQRRTIEVNRAETSISDFLEETLGLFQLEQRAGHNPLSVSIADDLTGFRVDGNRLRQAVLALLRNAVQASTPADPIELRVGAGENASVYVEVVDHGEGMPPDVLEQARTPFFSNFEPPGLGMGLGIAELVARGHGGRLELDSRPGEGTQVRLWLRPEQPSTPAEAHDATEPRFRSGGDAP